MRNAAIAAVDLRHELVVAEVPDFWVRIGKMRRAMSAAHEMQRRRAVHPIEVARHLEADQGPETVPIKYVRRVQ